MCTDGFVRHQKYSVNLNESREHDLKIARYENSAFSLFAFVLADTSGKET